MNYSEAIEQLKAGKVLRFYVCGIKDYMVCYVKDGNIYLKNTNTDAIEESTCNTVEQFINQFNEQTITFDEAPPFWAE